jgi:3-deoxy-D-manno-octulosonic-acid transferase
MAWLVYYLFMYLFVAGIKVTSLWDIKAQLWIAGRKHWLKHIKALPNKKYTRIWFHVSSLGEFEQARPVIEKLKSKDPQLDIILTFFSPSGYTVRSAYRYATVFYLPPDLPGNALKWVESVKPDIAIFVKYDLWPGYLRALSHQGVPAILISAHWERRRWFASWNLQPTAQLLRGFKRIFLQQQEDLEFFMKKGFTNLCIAGDTRIDRSLELAEEAISKIPESLKAQPVFDVVAGSTWPPDEKLLIEAQKELNIRLLLAPHDVSPKNITRLANSFSFPVAKLSTFKSGDPIPQVLIVDGIGLLAYLYSLGKIAYIGGGFGTGIHNTLEPMAHQKPVIFGPSFHKFPEAVALVKEKAGRCVRSASDLIDAIKYFSNDEQGNISGSKAYDYLVRHQGASEKVVQFISSIIPSRQNI